MAAVALDTDVASLLIKNRLPAGLAAQLVGVQTAITFITLGELTSWSIGRGWARRRAVLNQWLAARPVLPGNNNVARLWGELAGYARRRGRPRPVNDTWIAACCITFGFALATLNVNDFQDYVEHEGLVLITV